MANFNLSKIKINDNLILDIKDTNARQNINAITTDLASLSTTINDSVSANVVGVYSYAESISTNLNNFLTQNGLLSGPLNLKNNIVIRGTTTWNNDNRSVWSNPINFVDKNDKNIVQIRAISNTTNNGLNQIYIGTFQTNTPSTTAVYQNILRLGVDLDGNQSVNVSSQKAWRKGLGIGNDGDFPLPIAQGGTGATTATDAWTALGGGTIGKKSSLSTSDIPDLDADKITSGTFNTARIPNLDADKITSGTFNTARIPNLDADKITSGTLDKDRIPELDSKYLPLSGGTLTGPITLSTNGFRTASIRGFSTNTYGQFTHLTTNTNDSWGLNSYDGTDIFRINYETGSVISRGNFTIKEKTYDISTTNTVENNSLDRGFLIQDKASRNLGYIIGRQYKNGDVQVIINARRYNNETNINNNLYLKVSNDGTKSVTLSDPQAWRKAIGIGQTDGSFPLTIAQGGTGATSADAAWTALGGGTIGKKASLAASDIPNLGAAKITSGTLDVARIPSLDAAKITSGSLDIDRIPNLNSKYLPLSGGTLTGNLYLNGSSNLLSPELRLYSSNTYSSIKTQNKTASSLLNLIIQSNGKLILGGGNSSEFLYTAYSTGTSKDAYLTANNDIYIVSNVTNATSANHKQWKFTASGETQLPNALDTKYGGTGNANGTVAKLTTARTIRTNLGSTSAASFDGSANVTPGVTGVLPKERGGNGSLTTVNITLSNCEEGSVVTLKILGYFYYLFGQLKVSKGLGVNKYIKVGDIGTDYNGPVNLNFPGVVALGSVYGDVVFQYVRYSGDLILYNTSGYEIMNTNAITFSGVYMR